MTPPVTRLPVTPPSAPPYDPARYWSERLAAGPTLESVGWQGLGRAYNRWLYRQRARVFGRAAACYRFRDSPPRVLEVGPGIGFYVARWQELGVRELTGLEIAAPAVRHLRDRFPAYRFVEGDIGADPSLPADAFDVVTAFDVLFHITDDVAFDRALATIARALRPGGLVLISDLFPRDEPPRLPHQASRTAAVYRERLAAHGLVPERRWPVFVLMHPWADTRSRAARAAGRAWWALVERVAGHLPGGGTVLGATLSAADVLLTRLLHDGPSTELWAVRKG
jgi:SAM-dependent methyltransferase